MVVQTWSNVIVASLQNLWWGFINFFPKLLGAVVVLVVGLVVAAGLGALVEKIFEAIRVDSLGSRLGVNPYFERAGIRFRLSYFLGRIVYWFIVIAFLLAAADILQLTTLSSFLSDVLFYIPNVLVAVLIMLAAVVVANFLKHLVRASVSGSRLSGSQFLGTLTWWAVVIFGFLGALAQLGVAPTIVNALVTGFIAMLALAGGLAFGLGGRDYASHLVARLRESTEGH